MEDPARVPAHRAHPGCARHLPKSPLRRRRLERAGRRPGCGVLVLHLPRQRRLARHRHRSSGLENLSGGRRAAADRERRGRAALRPRGDRGRGSPHPRYGPGARILATGDSFNPPLQPSADAVVALDLLDGQVRWSKQLRPPDAESAPAEGPAREAAAHDFTASPILRTLTERPADPARRTALGHRLWPRPGALGRSAVANQWSREQGLRGHRSRHGGGSSRRVCRALGIRRRSPQSDRQPGRDRHEDGSEALAAPCAPRGLQLDERLGVRAWRGAGGHRDPRRRVLRLDGRAPARLFDHRRKDLVGLRHRQGLRDRQSSDGERRLAGPGRRDHRQRSRLRQLGQRTGQARATCCSPFQSAANRTPHAGRSNGLSSSLPPALPRLCTLRRPAPRTPRSAAPAPAIEDSVVKVFATMRYPDPFKPWTKQGPDRCDRLRRGHRRQAHLDQRARSALRDAGAGSGQCGRATRCRPPWSPWLPASTSPCSSSMTRASSIPIRRSSAPASCRRSRTRCSPTDSRPAARRCRSPRGSYRASNSSPTIFRSPAFASRWTRRSIPATAGARRSPATG